MEPALEVVTWVFTIAAIVLTTVSFLWRLLRFQHQPYIWKLTLCLLDISHFTLTVGILVALLSSNDGSTINCKIAGFFTLYGIQDSLWTLLITDTVFLTLSSFNRVSSTSHNPYHRHLLVLFVLPQKLLQLLLSILPITPLQYFEQTTPYSITCLPLREPYQKGSAYFLMLVVMFWIAIVSGITTVVVNLFRTHKAKWTKIHAITHTSDVSKSIRYRNNVIGLSAIGHIMWFLAVLLVTLNLYSESVRTYDSVTFLLSLCGLVHTGISLAGNFLGDKCCGMTKQDKNPDAHRALKKLEYLESQSGVFRMKCTWEDIATGEVHEGLLKVYQADKLKLWAQEIVALGMLRRRQFPALLRCLWAENTNPYSEAMTLITGKHIEPPSRLICVDLLNLGSLHGLLRDFQTPLNDWCLMALISDVAQGLAHLHCLSLQHNRLCPRNIYIRGTLETQNLTAAIGNFEHSHVKTDDADCLSFTEESSAYMDNPWPEQGFSFPADIRAFALVVLELMVTNWIVKFLGSTSVTSDRRGSRGMEPVGHGHLTGGSGHMNSGQCPEAHEDILTTANLPDGVRIEVMPRQTQGGFSSTVGIQAGQNLPASLNNDVSVVTDDTLSVQSDVPSDSSYSNYMSFHRFTTGTEPTSTSCFESFADLRMSDCKNAAASDISELQSDGLQGISVHSNRLEINTQESGAKHGIYPTSGENNPVFYGHSPSAKQVEVESDEIPEIIEHDAAHRRERYPPKTKLKSNMSSRMSSSHIPRDIILLTNQEGDTILKPQNVFWKESHVVSVSTDDTPNHSNLQVSVSNELDNQNVGIDDGFDSLQEYSTHHTNQYMTNINQTQGYVFMDKETWENGNPNKFSVEQSVLATKYNDCPAVDEGGSIMTRELNLVEGTGYVLPLSQTDTTTKTLNAEDTDSWSKIPSDISGKERLVALHRDVRVKARRRMLQAVKVRPVSGLLKTNNRLVKERQGKTSLLPAKRTAKNTMALEDRCTSKIQSGAENGNDTPHTIGVYPTPVTLHQTDDIHPSTGTSNVQDKLQDLENSLTVTNSDHKPHLMSNFRASSPGQFLSDNVTTRGRTIDHQHECDGNVSYSATMYCSGTVGVTKTLQDDEMVLGDNASDNGSDVSVISLNSVSHSTPSSYQIGVVSPDTAERFEMSTESGKAIESCPVAYGADDNCIVWASSDNIECFGNVWGKRQLTSSDQRGGFEDRVDASTSAPSQKKCLPRFGGTTKYPTLLSTYKFGMCDDISSENSSMSGRNSTWVASNKRAIACHISTSKEKRKRKLKTILRNVRGSHFKEQRDLGLSDPHSQQITMGIGNIMSQAVGRTNEAKSTEINPLMPRTISPVRDSRKCNLDRTLDDIREDGHSVQRHSKPTPKVVVVDSDLVIDRLYSAGKYSSSISETVRENDSILPWTTSYPRLSGDALPSNKSPISREAMPPATPSCSVPYSASQQREKMTSPRRDVSFGDTHLGSHFPCMEKMPSNMPQPVSVSSVPTQTNSGSDLLEGVGSFHIKRCQKLSSAVQVVTFSDLIPMTSEGVSRLRERVTLIGDLSEFDSKLLEVFRTCWTLPTPPTSDELVQMLREINVTG